MIDGISSQPFSARTLEPIENKKEFREQIIEISRSLYARPKAQVEKEILAERNLKNGFHNNQTNEQRLF